MSTLQERFTAKVQQQPDGCWEWVGAKDKNGYGRIRRDGRLHFAHRVSVELSTGKQPTQDIDHACRNRSCVNPEHLREVTHKENMENRSGAHRNSKSGVRGVTWHKASGKWRANISHKGKQIHLGLFARPEDADAAATAKRLELYTHNEVDRQQQQAA